MNLYASFCASSNFLESKEEMRAPLKQCIHFLYTAMVTCVYKLNAELAASLLASATEMKATIAARRIHELGTRSHFGVN
jgi:hypothetical protein